MRQLGNSWKIFYAVLAVVLVLGGLGLWGSSRVEKVDAQTTFNTKIYACVGNSSPTPSASLAFGGRAVPPNTLVRVIGTGGNCGTNETLITWNKSTARTLTVSPIGTPTENGAVLQAALGSIVDADFNNGYMLKIEPGIYDIGTNILQLQPFIDLEGSGEGVTVIQGTGRTSIFNGLILGSNNTELRFLTVSISGGNNAVAIYNTGSSLRLTNVTVKATDASSEVVGIYNINNATLTIRNSTISVSNGLGANVSTAIRNEANSSGEIYGSKIEATSSSGRGLYSLTNTQMKIYNSVLTGSQNSLRVESASNVKVANSQISGTATTSSSSLICVNSFNPEFALVSVNCNPVA